MHNPSSWYDTPLGRLSRGEVRRHTQPSVAEAVFEATTRPRFDPNLTELVCALSLGAGRMPFIP
jgi:hypothetical protein